MKYLFLALFLIGCASKKEIVISPNKEVAEPEKTFTAVNYETKPGEAFFIRFPDLRKNDEGILKCKKKKTPFYRGKDGLEAYVPETYFSKLKPFTCTFESGGITTEVAKVSVVDKTFPSEKLNVEKRKIFPPKKALVRIRKEQKFLNKNYSSSPPYPLFVTGFKTPLSSFVTSIYGSKRLYNNKKQSQHLGTDYRAPIGTPIFSANSGKVVVARDLYYTGNTVTLDHGVNIFTVYGHLNKVNVLEGEYVPKGTLIGWAGMTGRVTGPHLHWGVRVNNEWIEGDSLVEATKWLGE